MWRDDAGRSRWWLIPSVALLVDVAVIAFVQPQLAVRDEAVFYPAAQAFLRAGWLPSTEFLRGYPAPQTPLSLYLAGRLLALAPSLTLLRLVDCGLVFAALLRFARFASESCGKNAGLATAVLALNPYVHLAATHFYTDALYLFLLVLVVTRRPAAPAWLPLTLLPLTRQFGMLFGAGEALHALRTRRVRDCLLVLGTWLPTLALFALWHGPFPNTPRADTARTVHAAYGWFFPYVAAYHVAAAGCYLSPVLLRVPRSRQFWLGASLGAVLYLAAPAHPNFAAELADSGITTLGYFHRATLVFGVRPSHLVLFAFASLGGGLIAQSFSAQGPLRYFVALFFALSAFNFQAWDKYLLDVLPAALLALLSVPKQARVASEA
ncbi:MAG: hypothetical protein ABIQ16_05375 [Polyangiaceae bacterium]